MFPREGVWIKHDGGEPFVADANTVTYYNKGQCYTRRKLSARGDQCEWFAVAPEAIAETLSAHEPAAIDRPRSAVPVHARPERSRQLPAAADGVPTRVARAQRRSAVRRRGGAVDSGRRDGARLRAGRAPRPAGRAAPAPRRRSGGSGARRDRAPVHGQPVAVGYRQGSRSRRCSTSRGSSRRAPAFRCTPIATSCGCARRSSGWPSPAST